MKFKLKNGSSGSGPILAVEADKDDELAYVDAERVYRGDLDSFLPFTYDRGGKAYEFSYFLGSCISLDRVLDAPVASNVLRSALGSMLHMMQVCEANGLSRLRVVLDSEHVFYDPALGMLRFVYMPLRSYVSPVGEAGLISRICSATMADAGDQQFAVSVWDFVHRTTILTSVAFEGFLEGWGLQTPDSGHKRSRKSHSALGADTRSDHGWDFVTAIREDEARRKALQEAEERKAAEQRAAAERKVAEQRAAAGQQAPASQQTAQSGLQDAQPEQQGGKQISLLRLATGESCVLGLGRYVMGRSPDCTIPMPDAKSISRKHAELDVIEDGFVLRDLNSTNGVFVDGQRLGAGSEMRLAIGASFALGEEEFQLR